MESATILASPATASHRSSWLCRRADGLDGTDAAVAVLVTYGR
jgi:hypothetical protein